MEELQRRVEQLELQKRPVGGFIRETFHEIKPFLSLALFLLFIRLVLWK
jgi:predicted cupin superfamily sugar epimerase